VTAAVATLNLILGVAYCGYGVMTILELRRDRASFGFSHFGLAWIFMAFTCGPHHLAHGIHLALEGRQAGALDLIAVAIGLPVGVLWLALRVEAFTGGRGDRFLPGTPGWLRAAPALAVTYVVLLSAGMYVVVAGHVSRTPRTDHALLANVALVAIYMAIGWFVLRTQLANRPSLDGWSVSGLCLAVIFPTCALMHAVFASYSVSGHYHHDLHAMLIDWLSVPAGLYFLWVVRRLYRDALSDWNEGPAEVAPELVVSSDVRARLYPAESEEGVGARRNAS
jgi:uncharacterized membrane protein SirB2